MFSWAILLEKLLKEWREKKGIWGREEGIGKRKAILNIVALFDWSRRSAVAVKIMLSFHFFVRQQLGSCCSNRNSIHSILFPSTTVLFYWVSFDTLYEDFILLQRNTFALFYLMARLFLLWKTIANIGKISGHIQTPTTIIRIRRWRRSSRKRYIKVLTKELLYIIYHRPDGRHHISMIMYPSCVDIVQFLLSNSVE